MPFCRSSCPYCPYTKVAYDAARVDAFTQAACSEMDWWAEAVGDCALISIYVGGDTPTVALDSVAAVLGHARRRFRLSGDVAIETKPADVDAATAGRLRDMGVGLVSLGVQSFRARHLAAICRRYSPAGADRALSALAA